MVYHTHHTSLQNLQKQSKLINYVLGVDYELLDSDELSYYLTVLNDIQAKENEENVNAYEKLKTDIQRINFENNER